MSMDPMLITQLRFIGKIQSQIVTAKTLDEAIRGALHEIWEVFHVDMAVVWYANESKTMLRPYFWLGGNDLSSLACATGEGFVGRVFESGNSIRMLDASPEQLGDTPDVHLGDTSIRSMVCVPFSNPHEELGCIQFVNRTNGELFTEDDADAFEITALMAAIAIDDNVALHDPWVPGSTVMALRNVTRDFVNGEITTKVLRGINLDVYEGEFLTLLGESGCGKTTLLNIVGGLDHVTSGSVRYLDQDLTKATQAQLTEFRRANLGFIFQSYNLMPNLNALQNVRLIAELVDNPMDPEEALELVGLKDRMRNYPSQLSGGQQQRVSIARALVKRPRLILADEPTAALDYTTSIEVLQVLEKIIDAGTTLVMVTHNEEITRMADRVVRLRTGRTHETIINRHRAQATDLVW
ncbi:MAG: ATP-binding cassette domain-containing protein [Coriobacteriales bacterium]|nr:ATP-binding cassette domain-containing protein [Coriobacteriales bacterium]